MRRDKLVGLTSGRNERGGEAPKRDNEIAKINKGSKKLVLENNHMLMAEVLKAMVFSTIGEKDLVEESVAKDEEMKA